MEAAPPIPLVYVFRVLFKCVYGQFRLLSCPVFGLTESVIRKECKLVLNIQRALSIFTAEGSYCFSGLRFGIGETLRARVISEVEKINSGEGGDLIEAVLHWLRIVRVRALQDLAVCQALEFNCIWTSTNPEQWKEHSKIWETVLRTREDSDIGWVATVETPNWNPGVAALKLGILEAVCAVEDTVKKEDMAYWSVCSRDLCKGVPSPEEEGAQQVQGEGVIAEAAVDEIIASDTEHEVQIPEVREETVLPESKKGETTTHSTVGLVPVSAPHEELMKLVDIGDTQCEDVKHSGLGITSIDDVMPENSQSVEEKKIASVADIPNSPTATDPCSSVTTGQPRYSLRIDRDNGILVAEGPFLPADLTKGEQCETNLLGAIADAVHGDRRGSNVTDDVTTPILGSPDGVKDASGTVSKGPSTGSPDVKHSASVLFTDVADSEHPRAQAETGSEYTTAENIGTSLTLQDSVEPLPNLTQGNTVPTVFPEIRQILEDNSSPPVLTPLITLSQFHNTAHGGEDMVVDETAFSQDPSFQNWVKGNPDANVRAPYKGVSIIPDNSGPQLPIVHKDSTCRNLRATFDEEEELEDTAAELVNLAQQSDLESKSAIGEADTVEDKEVARVVAAAPWPGCAIIRLEEVAVMTLSQAYNYLHVEDLMQTLPGRRGKRDGALDVVFFSEKNKEMEVKFQAIRDLKRVRTRLGNDIVDFVMSRLFFQYSPSNRHEILFALSRVSSTYRRSMEDPASVLRWATTFLLPPSPVKVHQVKEILVPWVDHDHWSLLVFQYGKVVHLDSAEKEYHQPVGRDAAFVNAISHAWQTLRGVEPYAVPVLKLEVLKQAGNYECGHHTIRNSMLYLKVTYYPLTIPGRHL